MNTKISNYVTALENSAIKENWHTEQSIYWSELECAIVGCKTAISNAAEFGRKSYISFHFQGEISSG
jgi:hypothetical protein